MSEIDDINRVLRNLTHRGITIPSSKAAYRITMNDVFTPSGYVRKGTSPERLKQVKDMMPELFSKELIESNAQEAIVRLIQNYNSTVHPSERILINTRELSPRQMNRLRVSINRKLHISNIYLPEFGQTLREAIEEALATKGNL